MGLNSTRSRLSNGDRLRPAAKAFYQRIGDGARRSGSDFSAVDVHNRDDLAGRAGEKRFVRSEQILVTEHRLFHGNAAFSTDLEHKLARNAWEEARVERRRQR